METLVMHQIDSVMLSGVYMANTVVEEEMVVITVGLIFPGVVSVVIVCHIEVIRGNYNVLQESMESSVCNNRD